MSDYTPSTTDVKTFYELGVLDRTTRNPDGEFDRWIKGMRKDSAAEWKQSWFEAVHTLDIIRAEYARYLTHHDTYELARAIGQVISEPVYVLPEDQRLVVQHPDDEGTDG